MTSPSNPREIFSPFLPTTYNVPEEQDRLGVFLVDRFANFADVINDKRIGLFVQESENQNGEKWFYTNTKITRNGFQAISHISSFPNVGVLTLTLTSVPGYPIQGVNPEFVVTQVWGSASKPCSAIGAGDGDYFSFFSEGNSKITFTMSDIQIVITTTADMTAYSGFIVVQYLRNGV
jgi:hypothetical protein